MKLGKWLFALASVVVLAGCGGGGSDGGSSDGGGGGGQTGATSVDESNKTAVAQTAKVGSEQAIASSEVPTVGRSLNREPLSYRLMKDTVTAFDRNSMARTTVDLSSSVCTAGGSLTYDIPQQASQSGAGTYTIVYNDCAYADGFGNYVIDGTVKWIVSENSSFSYEYDLTSTYGGETTAITGTYSCDADFNCSYDDTFVEGGTSYTISNASVSGNNNSGYNVSVRVTNENFGYVDVVASGLVTCPGGGFSSGSIDVSDSSGSMVLEVDFVSCSQMTVTFNGVAETVAQ